MLWCQKCMREHIFSDTVKENVFQLRDNMSKDTLLKYGMKYKPSENYKTLSRNGKYEIFFNRKVNSKRHQRKMVKTPQTNENMSFIFTKPSFFQRNGLCIFQKFSKSLYWLEYRWNVLKMKLKIVSWYALKHRKRRWNNY